MRKLNSLKNIIASTTLSIITMLAGFIIQTIFLKQLGTEYLGINSLFANIVSMLAIAELGIGTAIVYNLYKPISNNDIDVIKSLMKLYKKCYTYIAIIISIIGVCIMPFLSLIVGKVNIAQNIYLIFLLFLIDTICSYLLTYKRSILFAQQKNYIVNIIHLLYLIIMSTLQILVLIFTKNFLLFLTVKIIMRIIENVIITLVSNKMYPYITEKNVNKLDKGILEDIIKKVKALLLHKLAGFIVFGTDNIIISMFLGITCVGLYSNYNLILIAVNTIVSQIFVSLTASIGNMLVTEIKEKSLEIFKKVEFLNFLVFNFCSICIYLLAEPFIKLWIGEEYILPNIVLLVLVVNFYIQGMRRNMSVFKEAAGIYYEDRFIPLVESLINIVASVALVKVFGLAGVFMGTIISTLVLFLYSYPKYVYKKLFDKSGTIYVLEFFKYLIVFIVCITLTYTVANFNRIDNVLVQLVLNLGICIVVPNIIMYFIFKNTEEFKYFIDIIKKVTQKFTKKINL